MKKCTHPRPVIGDDGRCTTCGGRREEAALDRFVAAHPSAFAYIFLALFLLCLGLAGAADGGGL